MRTSIKNRRLIHDLTAETQAEKEFLTSLVKAILKVDDFPIVYSISWNKYGRSKEGITVYDSEFNTLYPEEEESL